jgi:hypothetical protein
MTIPDVREVLAGAIDHARQNDDLVHLDLADAEALQLALARTPLQLDPGQVRRLELAVDGAWDELSAYELNAMISVQTSCGHVRRRLSAVRAVLAEVEAAAAETEA